MKGLIFRGHIVRYSLRDILGKGVRGRMLNRVSQDKRARGQIHRHLHVDSICWHAGAFETHEGELSPNQNRHPQQLGLHSTEGSSVACACVACREVQCGGRQQLGELRSQNSTQLPMVIDILGNGKC